MEYLLRILLENKFSAFAQKFIEKQNWQAIRENELIIGYEEILSLANKTLYPQNISLDKLYQEVKNQLVVSFTYKKLYQVDLLITIEDFILSVKQAQFGFLLEIKKIQATEQACFFDKIKISCLNLLIQTFPQATIRRLFDQKIFEPGIKTTVTENKIHVDFQAIIPSTPIGKTFLGLSVLDFVTIDTITTENKGLGVKFNLYIPEWIKSLLLMLISTKINRYFNKTTAKAASSKL